MDVILSVLASCMYLRGRLKHGKSLAHYLRASLSEPRVPSFRGVNTCMLL